MQFAMQSALSASGLEVPQFESVFIGDVVDDRGQEAVAFVGQVALKSYSLYYDPDQLEIKLDGARFPAESIADNIHPLNKSSSILLEATTLGFVEIFLICRALREQSVDRISILYTEPKRYRSQHRSHLLHRRDFELTDSLREFSGIPGAVLLLRDGMPVKALFLLGFEGNRLDHALETMQLNPAKCCVLFGIPAFQPGWELDSLANNVGVIEDRGVRGGILFGGAQNPKAAYDAILEVYQSCSQVLGERLIVAPIGTKPHGIGAALFASEYDDVGLIYDHAFRSQGRSSDVGTWHYYSVLF